MSLRFVFALVFCAASLPARASQPATLVKHTVSGAGTFEQGRRLRAPVDRATFHPIDRSFALSVSGRMGWVITGQWTRQGSTVALTVANMNNAPARGAGELKLDERGTVESIKLTGSSNGAAYQVRFKAGASPAASPTPPIVRLGPSAPRPRPPAASAAERDPFDRTRHGTGALHYAGAPLIPLTAGAVELTPAGRVSVRVTGGGATHRFEGVWGSGGDRSVLDLTLHPSDGPNGVVTGTARMDASGHALDRLDLQGFRGDRVFQLTFRAGR